MTKTFNISCEIKLFDDFKQLLNSRNEKISTVIQSYMRAEIIQSNKNYDSIESRIEALEVKLSEVLKDKVTINV